MTDDGTLSSDVRWYLDSRTSDTASKVQRELRQSVSVGDDPSSDLRDCAFGLRTSHGRQRMIMLRNASKRSIGEVMYCRSRQGTDLVREYVGVLLHDGTTFEEIHLAIEPLTLRCHRNGEPLCELTERQVHDESGEAGFLNWLRRTFCPRREWIVNSGTVAIGRIAMQYPIGTAKPLLYWETNDLQLPIRVIKRDWLGRTFDPVIPSEGPLIEDPSLLFIQFALNIAFRICILKCDFSSL